MSRHIPYFSFYPADFMNGVRGLSAQEVGVYTMILCRIYEENGPIEANALRLSTYCGMREKTFSAVLEKLVVLGKFNLENGMLSNRRAMQEIQKRSDGLKNNSKAGKASAEKRQEKQRKKATDVQQSFNHTDTDTDTEKVDANASTCAATIKAPSFDEFWSAWPLGKVGKDAARKAFGRLSPQQRIGATTRAAEWCASWRAANPRLNDIHPSTYLNNKRWQDEMAPSQPALTLIPGGPRDQSSQPRQPSRADASDRQIAFAARAARTPSADCF